MNDLLFRSQKMSDWLKKIRKERQKRFALFHEQIAILLTKNELLARKTKEKIPNPVNTASSSNSMQPQVSLKSTTQCIGPKEENQ